MVEAIDDLDKKITTMMMHMIPKNQDPECTLQDVAKMISDIAKQVSKTVHVKKKRLMFEIVNVIEDSFYIQSI